MLPLGVSLIWGTCGMTRWKLLAVLCALVGLTGACASLRGSETAVGDVEALRPKAAEVTDKMVANDWKAVRADFDETMAKGLAEDGLANAWAQVVQLKGAYVSRGEPTQVPKPGQHLVFDTPMTFEKGDMKSRITFHADGRIAGLFILVPEAT